MNQGGRNFRVDVYEPPQGDTRFKVTDMTQGRVSNKTGQPVGKPIVRVDVPDGRTPHHHLNVENLPKGLERLGDNAPKGLNHAKIPNIPTGVLRAAKHAPKALLPLAIAADTIDLAIAYQRDQKDADGDYSETKKAVGRVAGGWGGAAAGAAVGMAIGSAVPVLGTAVGGIIGGLIGGLGGGIGGSSLGGWIGSKL